MLLSVASFTTLTQYAFTTVLNVGIDNDLISDTRQKYRVRRFMDAWKYGSGCDYVFEGED